MSRISIRRFPVLALCAGLLLPGPALAQRGGDDLDRLTPNQLAAALYAELDDVFDHLDPDGEYSDKQLFDEVMEALSDDGDDDSEGVITLAELEDEMAEAGVSLQDVVWNAVQMSDRVSENSRPGIIRVDRPGAARTRVAVQYVQSALTQAIRRRV